MDTIESLKPLLAGVIGQPIFHSKSPKLHNYWLKENKIDGYYIPIEVEPNDLLSSLKSLIDLGFQGVNVTIPHKTSVLSFAHTVSDRAAIIGAANTLFFNSDKQIVADNTDSYGFIQNLYTAVPKWNPNEGPALVFGAGGAAKAVCFALLSEGVPSVRILNRTKVKAEIIAENLGARVEVIDWYSVKDALDGIKTVVNTTSLGMKGQPELTIDFSRVSRNTLVTDLVYNPVKTKFLKLAEEEGLKIVDGFGMLLHQAVPGFLRWFGKKPIVTKTLRQKILSL